MATTAATAGVLLGGFVAVELLATPKPQSPGPGTAQAALETKAAPKPAPPETTGSAPAGEGIAASDCDQQAWPHLSRDCMEEYRNKNQPPRVVSTDRLDKPAVAAVEASPPAQADEAKLAAPALWAPSVASPAPPAVAPPVKTVSAPPQAAAPSPAPAATAAPEPQPVAAATDTQATSQADLKNEAKEKRVAKKAKRKPKVEPRIPAKLDPRAPADDDGSTFASSDSDDRASGDRATRRPDRSRRIVERWTERDYDVPDARGDGRRRVTVIRRSGGGLFGNLFGSHSRDDDD
jgi:hypothetical protein